MDIIIYNNKFRKIQHLQCCVSSHLIHAIRNGESFLIGNNHGHMNGWVSKNKIYGKVAEIL